MSYAFALLPDPSRFAGQLLVEGGKGEQHFATAHELSRIALGTGATRLMVAGAAEPKLALQLAMNWPAAQGPLLHIEDAAYLFDLTKPQRLGDFPVFWRDLSAELDRVSDDLLAQMIQLTVQAGLNGRLGWLSAELERRFDLLNVPDGGAVDPSQLYPSRSPQSVPAKQELATDLLERLFTARRAFESAFEGYEDRPQQQQMATAVEQALAEQRSLVVEAGTGVGKSLAYLLPLALHSARTGQLCLVSTNTINLQQQLMELDVPRLRRVLDNLDVRVSLLKGREHYFCVKRAEELWLKNSAQLRARRSELLDTGLPALLFVLKALLSAQLHHGGDLDAVLSPPGLRPADRIRLSGAMDCRYQTCLGDRCEHRGNCHYFTQRDAALRSNITITNHALVFALFRPGEADAENLVGKASVVVFDEAHNLESAITNQYTLEVGDKLPIELGNRLAELVQEDGVKRRLQQPPSQLAESWQEPLERVQRRLPELPQWMRLAAEVRAQVDSLLAQARQRGALEAAGQAQLSPATAEGQQTQVIGILGRLAQRFLPVVERMAAVAQDLQALLCTEQSPLYTDDPQVQMDAQSLSADLNSCREALANWRPEDPSSITWFNANAEGGLGAEAGWEYRTAPLAVGTLFQQLASSKESVVLCSATLTVDGTFDYVRQSLGFDKLEQDTTEWLKLSSPFDYRRQALLLMATDMDTPTGAGRDRYLTQLEEMVAQAAELFSGGVLVLFNSYRDLNHIAGELELSPLAPRLLVQGQSGSRGELADRFRASGSSILLATRSFWEGFDVAGEALQCVILAKLPFANFRDPIHAGRQRAIEAGGGDSFMRYSLPLAAMQLKQGFGRLIRRGTDRGCVFLLDSRAAKARYGQTFVMSLPGPRTFSGPAAQCLEEAKRFMAEAAVPA